MRRPFERLWASRHRAEWLLLLLALASLALAWVFAKVGSEVLEGELTSVDRAVRQWMLAHRSPAGLAVFNAITLFGAKEVLAPLALLVGWRVFRDSKWTIALLVLSALACAEFVAVVKRSLHVVRPVGGIEAGLGFSFPSGHSAGSMAVAIVLCYAAVRRNIRPGLFVTVAAMAVILVGVSRLYLDLHWTSDVLGGWLVGAAFGVGCCALYELIRRRQSSAETADPSLRSGWQGSSG